MVAARLEIDRRRDAARHHLLPAGRTLVAAAPDPPVEGGTGQGAGMMQPLLEARGLNKRFGAVTAARDIEVAVTAQEVVRSEEHTSELQSLMRISYAVFCLKQNKIRTKYEMRHN